MTIPLRAGCLRSVKGSKQVAGHGKAKVVCVSKRAGREQTDRDEGGGGPRA